MPNTADLGSEGQDGAKTHRRSPLGKDQRLQKEKWEPCSSPSKSSKSETEGGKDAPITAEKW